MSLAPARWFFPGLLGSDVDEEEQAALELEMDLLNCTIMDPRLVVPAANFYHWYDHRSTLDELEKRFPSGGSTSWRSQFRFERHDLEELVGRLELPPHGFHLRETGATSVIALAMTLNFFAWPKTGYLMEDTWHTDRRKISA